MESKLSADFVRDIFRTMNVGLVVQDRNGHIVEVNSAAERVLGLTFDQLRGRSSIDPRWHAIHEDGSDFPGDTHPASVTLATGKAQIAVPMGIHKPNGTLTWIEVTSHPHFLGDNPKPNSVATTFTDITHWKQAITTASNASPRVGTSSPPSDRIVAGGPLRILVVDDTPMDRTVIGKHLGIHYGAPTFACNGEEALEHLAQEHFDLVLMDCQMPKLDGFETTRRIRSGELGPTIAAIPILAMTAHTLESERLRCLEAGMDEHIGKPVRHHELIASIERHRKVLAPLTSR